jgi:hypothetical protein
VPRPLETGVHEMTGPEIFAMGMLFGAIIVFLWASTWRHDDEH